MTLPMINPTRLRSSEEAEGEIHSLERVGLSRSGMETGESIERGRASLSIIRKSPRRGAAGAAVRSIDRRVRSRPLAALQTPSKPVGEHPPSVQRHLKRMLLRG